MSADAAQLLIVFLAIFGPFLLLFLIAGILSPRYQAFADRRGWTVQPHPEDRRDYLFRGQNDGIQWEMEFYIYEHYRRLTARQPPFTRVIVWESASATLPDHSVLIFPRKDKLIHIVHPRLSLENETDLAATRERKILEKDLLALPEKSAGSPEFQQRLILRTDVEVLPASLMNRLQYELLSWAKIQFIGPVVLINRAGVTVWWIPLGMRQEWLDKTVALGTALASSLT